MTNRLELNWKLDDLVDEQRYYCSETEIDPENLPIPKAVLGGDARTYIDTAIETGKTYYVAISSVKNNVEKLSDVRYIFTGVLWSPSNLVLKSWIGIESLVTDISNRVGELTDMSGSGMSFRQGNNTNKPLLANNEIVFDGITSRLEGDALTRQIFMNAQHAWCFAVVRRTALDASSADKTLFASHMASSTGVRFIVQQNSSGSSTNNLMDFGTRRTDAEAFNNLLSNQKAKTEYQIILAKVDFAGGVKELYIDGVLESSITVTIGSTPSTQALVPANIGAYYTTNSGWIRHTSMSLKSMIIGASELTAENRQKLEGWAAHKYGLTANLPIDHPYKILVPTI